MNQTNITDAIGNPIIVNDYYGYELSKNGHTKIITGKAIEIKNEKVVLDEIAERNYVYLKSTSEPHNISHPERKRTMVSKKLFHLPNYK